MAQAVEQLVVSLEARLTQFEKSFQRASKVSNDNWNQIEGRGARAAKNLEKTFSTTSDNINKALAKITGGGLADFGSKAATGIAAALSVETVRRYSDAWQEASNKIGTAFGDMGKAAATTDLVADIAQRSRGSFAETATLYANLTRSSKELKASQGEVAVVTETVSKALALSGANASESAAAVLQLGQALGSGRLQGDELRSILENAPLLAEAIAKEFNTTVAGLKQLGSDGELSAERVFKALLNASQEVDRSFASTTATTSQAFNQLETAAIRFVGTSNLVKGATGALTGIMQGLANHMNVVGTGVAALGTIITTRLLAAGITPAMAAIGELGLSTMRLAPALAGIGTAAGSAATAMSLFGAALRVVGGPVGAAILGLVAVISYVATKAGEGKDINEAYAKAFDQVKAAADQAAPSIRSAGDAAADAGVKIAEATKKAEENKLGVMQQDSENLSISLRAMIADLQQFGAIGLDKDGKKEALEALKAALDGDAQAAMEARQKLQDMANAKPQLGDLFAAFDAILSKLATVRQAAIATANAIKLASQDKMIAESTRGLDTRGEDARNAAFLAKKAKADYDAEQERLSSRSKEAKRLEDRIAQIKADAKKGGFFVGDDEATNMARRYLDAEDAAAEDDKTPKGGGGRQAKAKLDDFEREEKASRKRIAELQAETAALGKDTFEAAKAEEETRLLNAAKEAGRPISDELRAKIDQEATAYANAKVKLEETKKAIDDANKAKEFFASQLESAISGLLFEGKSLTETFKNLADAIGKAALQALLLGQGPLAGLFGMGAPGGGNAVCGLLGSLLGGLGGGAAAGIGAGSAMFLVDGGPVHGPGGPTDDRVPAMLSHGEYVVSAAATAKHRRLLEAINSGQIAHFANGGPVGASAIASSFTSASAGSGAPVVHLAPNVTVNATGGDHQQNTDLAKRVSREVEATMRQLVAGELRQAIRPGGLLMTAMGSRGR